MNRSVISLLRLTPARVRASLATGGLLGVLALLLVLTQQGGQAHALAHELSTARGQAIEVFGAAGEPVDLAAAAQSEERDAVDAACVLCVGFANTLATAGVPAAGLLPLLVLGEFRPTRQALPTRRLLSFPQPIRGPPAAFSLPR